MPADGNRETRLLAMIVRLEGALRSLVGSNGELGELCAEARELVRSVEAA